MAETSHITWGQRIRTWFVVTLITVLVWLYAEGQAVTEEWQEIQVRFVAPPGQQWAIEPEGRGDDQTIAVSARLRGSNGELARLQQIIEEGPIELELPTAPEGETRAGERSLDLRDALYRSKLGELGVNILELNPARISLHVVPLTTQSLSVELNTTHLPYQFRSPPTIQPDSVQVTVPEHQVDDDLSEYSAVAQLNQRTLSQLQPNTPQTLTNIDVQIPEALQSRWTRVQPREVQVTLTITKQPGTTTLNRLAVELSVSPSVLQQYDFQVAQEDLFLRDVTLTGPADVIRQIEQEYIEIRPIIRPTSDKLDAVGSEPTVVQMPVQLDLPPDVTATDYAQEIPVTVTRTD